MPGIRPTKRPPDGPEHHSNLRYNRCHAATSYSYTRAGTPRFRFRSGSLRTAGRAVTGTRKFLVTWATMRLVGSLWRDAGRYPKSSSLILGALGVPGKRPWFDSRLDSGQATLPERTPTAGAAAIALTTGVRGARSGRSVPRVLGLKAAPSAVGGN